jgi:thiamine-monophosphate kinase
VSGSDAGPALGPGPEFDLIRRILARAAAGEVEVGPGDDAAVLRGGIVVSVDMAVEDVHFRRSWLTPEEIGGRAAAAALSDLAAMAATPVGALLSLALPAGDVAAAAALADGARSVIEAAGAALLGGDVSGSPGPWILDVVAIGSTPRPALRRGARAGDELWVTGELGGTAAALYAWSRGIEPPPGARRRFASPRPRIREALWLADRGLVRAMIDVSDGVAGDAGHIAAASGARAILEVACLPVDADASATGDGVRLALSGGEDYELLFAAAAGLVEPERPAFEDRFGARLTRIGRITNGEGAWLQDEAGSLAPAPAGGFQHFRTEAR